MRAIRVASFGGPEAPEVADVPVPGVSSRAIALIGSYVT